MTKFLEINLNILKTVTDKVQKTVECHISFWREVHWAVCQSGSQKKSGIQLIDEAESHQTENLPNKSSELDAKGSEAFPNKIAQVILSDFPPVHNDCHPRETLRSSLEH